MSVARPYSAVCAALGWSGLGLQLYLLLHTAALHGTSPVGAAISYISYFTILSNILLAAAFTVEQRTPRIVTAIVVYMTVVGLTYSLVLRRLWDPTGAQLVADRLLHDVMPIAAVVYWFCFVARGQLRWRDAATWLAFPVAYMVYVMIRGALTGVYPYPFADVSAIGYPRALLNAGVLVVGFWGVGLLFIATDRLRATRL